MVFRVGFLKGSLGQLENHGSRSLNPGRSRVHIPAGSLVAKIREPHHIGHNSQPSWGQTNLKIQASVWNGGWNLPSWELELVLIVGGRLLQSTESHFQALLYTHTAIPLWMTFTRRFFLYSQFPSLWSGSRLQPRSSSRDKIGGRMHPMGTFHGRKKWSVGSRL